MSNLTPPAAGGLLEIRPAPFTSADAGALIAEVQAEYVARYGGPDRTPLDPTMFDAPEGAFFVGYLDDGPVAMGGWRLRREVQRLGGSLSAEIKRMYVAPRARRRGLARAVLLHLEDTARSAGADVMLLETGIAQPEAIALYESSGYLPVEKFGYYAESELSRCYGKPL